jgi:putative colanic acid biosynthesis acetyltransferase WcaB
MATISEDLKRNKGNIKGAIVVTLFRLAHHAASWRHGFASKILWLLALPYLIAYRLGVEWVLGIELPQHLRVGAGLIVYHGQSLVVQDNVQIGRNCTLRHNTTIGAKLDRSGKVLAPVIGDNVDFGAQVVVLGPIVIGDDAIIGAGSVVVKDVPSRSVVAGNPARVISTREQ